MLYSDSPGNWQVYLRSGIVFIQANYVTTGSGSWDSVTCPYTLPEAYRPASAVNAPAITANGYSTTGMLIVGNDGVIKMTNQGGAGSSSQRCATLSYPL